MRLRFGLLVILLLNFAAVAQTATPGGNRPQPAQRGFKGEAHELNLTDQQKSQIEGLRKAERAQRQVIEENSSLTPEQKREQLRQLRQSSHDQEIAALTPEQQQRFQQRHQHAGGIGPLAQLDLTPDQKSKIGPIIQADRQQTRAALGDRSLTPEQKQAKLQDIRRSTNSQIETVLSPNQRQRLQQFKQHRADPSGSKAVTAQPSGS